MPINNHVFSHMWQHSTQTSGSFCDADGKMISWRMHISRHVNELNCTFVTLHSWCTTASGLNNPYSEIVNACQS